MANRPNRRRGYRIISGVTMTAGYEDSRRPTQLRVEMRGGQAFNAEHPGEPPLAVDADGLLVHRGASAGYGFLPNEGEIERLSALGIAIASAEELKLRYSLRRPAPTKSPRALAARVVRA